MTTAITLHTIDNEPRVLDTDLAERLGMARPRDIRGNLIKPNHTELETFGNLREENANAGRPGRPAMAYYLNEEQALLICMFSKTSNAALVRKQVIETFMAHRRGQLVPATQVAPALPDFSNPAIAARAWAEQFEMRQAAEVNGDDSLKRCVERLTAWTVRAREFSPPAH